MMKYQFFGKSTTTDEKSVITKASRESRKKAYSRFIQSERAEMYEEGRFKDEDDSSHGRSCTNRQQPTSHKP